MVDWDTLPRLLWDLCDGHPGRSVELYRFDYASGSHSWLCKNCYVHALARHGSPAAVTVEDRLLTEHREDTP